MRILHAILSEAFYGSERYCVELAVAQARAGHDVCVLSYGNDTDCGRRLAAAADAASRDDEVKAHRGSLRQMTIPRLMPAIFHRLLATRAIRRFSPDIVHSHLNVASRRIGRMAQRQNIPHVATLHIVYAERDYDTCDGLICIANWQRAQVPANFGGEVTVIWNWLPVAVRQGLARTTSADIAALRREWRAGGDTIVFGSVGRLAPEKGMERLVSGFRQAFPRGDEKVALTIVGDGPQHNELKERAGGDPRIVFVGTVASIASHYLAFDIYVSAARFEPFGLTILEAMAAGLPLIATRTDGPREFVTDGRVRWIEPAAAAGLVDAMRAAVSAGRSRLDYNLERFFAVPPIDEFYERVIMRNRQRRA